MTDKMQRKLSYLDGQIIQAQMLAHWWMARATSGEAENRKIIQGKHSLTPHELIADAIKNAHLHISRIENLIDEKDKIFADAEAELAELWE